MTVDEQIQALSFLGIPCLAVGDDVSATDGYTLPDAATLQKALTDAQAAEAARVAGEAQARQTVADRAATDDGFAALVKLLGIGA